MDPSSGLRVRSSYINAVLSEHNLETLPSPHRQDWVGRVTCSRKAHGSMACLDHSPIWATIIFYQKVYKWPTGPQRLRPEHGPLLSYFSSHVAETSAHSALSWF